MKHDGEKLRKLGWGGRRPPTSLEPPGEIGDFLPAAVQLSPAHIPELLGSCPGLARGCPPCGPPRPAVHFCMYFVNIINE